MPNYLFRLGSPDGQVIERNIEAVDLSSAREEVVRQGFHIFQVRKSGFSFRDLLPGKKVISTERFLLFNQELLALVKAGLPIIQSFDIMLERQKNLRFREVLTDIREKAEVGRRALRRLRLVRRRLPADLLDLASRRRALRRSRRRAAPLPALSEDHRQPAQARRRRADLSGRPGRRCRSAWSSSC